MFARCFICLACVVIALQPAFGQDLLSYGDIIVQPKVSPRPEPGDGPAHGNIEYRFAIANLSKKRSHQVMVQFPYGGENLRVLRTVTLGPEEKAEIAFFHPLGIGVLYGGARLFIDGQSQENAVPVANVNIRWGGGMRHGMSRLKYIAAPEALVRDLSMNVHKSAVLHHNLVDPNLKFEEPIGGIAMNPGERQQHFTYQGRNYFYDGVNSFSNLPEDLRNWSPNWLAYSSLDGVVVRGSELERAPVDVRAALFQFVECGGSLLVLGLCSIPEAWRGTAEKLKDGMTRYSPGFGSCLLTANDAIDQWTPQTWLPIVEAWHTAAAPWTNQHDMYSANSIFPVVESFGIPVRGLFMVMLVFAIVIGPVNMYVLDATRRRIWLLWTVPLISFLTCIAVFGYMYAAEGWYGHSRTEGLTVLDEVGQRATSIGWTAYYSPLTPADGLHFDYGTELSPQIMNDQEDHRFGHRRQQYQRHRSIDWSSDQHLQSGWVSARLPVHFKYRRSERRLERIVMRKEANGSYTVVNGLKGNIKHLWVADSKGKIAAANNIAAGAEARLTTCDRAEAGGTLASLREFYRGDWANLATNLPSSPTDNLRPGCYLAEMEGAPFLPNGLVGARKSERSIVYGIMKEPIPAY